MQGRETHTHRVFAHRGAVQLEPDGPYRTRLRLIGDGSAVLGIDNLRTLIGLLIGELVRIVGGERHGEI